jgi:ABC-type glycerol-3-phosphate transport system substrate-binding protein
MKFKKKNKKQEAAQVVAHAFNTSIQEAEAGGSLSSRPAWSTE